MVIKKLIQVNKFSSSLNSIEVPVNDMLFINFIKQVNYYGTDGNKWLKLRYKNPLITHSIILTNVMHLKFFTTIIN